MITKQVSQSIQNILSCQSRQNSRAIASLTNLPRRERIISNNSSPPITSGTIANNHRISTDHHPILHNHSLHSCIYKRNFHTETDFHNVADSTLETIQDTLDYYFEDNPSFDTPDINYASGVFNVSLSKGTWVLNKQTPNRQIWWSSPITGPRRYEFNPEEKKWTWTKYVDYCDAGANGDWKDTKYLGEALKVELIELYSLEDGLEELDDL